MSLLFPVETLSSSQSLKNRQIRDSKSSTFEMTLCVDHCGTLVSVESRIRKKSVIEVFKGTIVEKKPRDIFSRVFKTLGQVQGRPLSTSCDQK